MTAKTIATAALFPGQGVSLAGSRELVAETCPRLHASCCGLLGDDPFERAGESTRFAQPAIFLASIAGWTRLDADATSAFAGHSLGELSALAAAGALHIDDAVSLVVLRGALMADAAERQGDGGMLAILKGTTTDARELSQAHGVDVANDNAPGQTVLSGAHAALGDAAADARARGLRAMRTRRLRSLSLTHDAVRLRAVSPSARRRRNRRASRAGLLEHDRRAVSQRTGRAGARARAAGPLARDDDRAARRRHPAVSRCRPRSRARPARRAQSPGRRGPRGNRSRFGKGARWRRRLSDPIPCWPPARAARASRETRACSGPARRYPSASSATRTSRARSA